jgi:PleD family two-component response regulator
VDRRADRELDRLGTVPDRDGAAARSCHLALRQPGESSDAVVKRADEALYEAKAAGRDRTRLSTATV